jgi:hypothetical protein
VGKNRKGRTRIQRRISVTESPPERHSVHTELGVLRSRIGVRDEKASRFRNLTDYVLYDPTCQEQLTAIKNLVNSYDPSPALAAPTASTPPTPSTDLRVRESLDFGTRETTFLEV